MTNQEAIKNLKSKMDGKTDISYDWCETVRLAIKALEQEPCEDAVSRKELLEHFDELVYSWENRHLAEALRQWVKSFPSVQPVGKDINVTTTEDAISRTAAKHALCNVVHNGRKLPCPNQTTSCLSTKGRVCDFVEELNKLPSVQPQTVDWDGMIEEIENKPFNMLYVNGGIMPSIPKEDAIKIINKYRNGEEDG